MIPWAMVHTMRDVPNMNADNKAPTRCPVKVRTPWYTIATDKAPKRADGKRAAKSVIPNTE